MQITILRRVDTDHFFKPGLHKVLTFSSHTDSVMILNHVAVECGEAKVFGVFEVPDGSEIAEVMGGELALFIPGRTSGMSAADAAAEFDRVA